MGKKSIWRRVLAVVLALSMVCSVQTMSVYADIFGLETRPVQQTADQPEQNETEPTVTPTPTPEAEATPTPIPESENEEDGSSRVVYTNHTSTVKEAVNFRREMDKADNSNIITVLKAGTVVKVLAKETVGNMEWYQIKAEVTTVDTATGESTVQIQTGYVSAEYLDEPQMVQTEDSTEEKDPEITGDDDQESEETEETGDPAVTEINKSGITTGEVHLRSEASKESASLGVLAVNTEVFVLTEIQTETEGIWYNVNVPSSEEEGTQQTGYVSGDYLQITDETTSDETEGEGDSDVEETPISETAVVTEATSLYEEPSTESTVLAALEAETTVSLTAQIETVDEGLWYKAEADVAVGEDAEAAQKIAGYLSASSLEIQEATDEPEEILLNKKGTVNQEASMLDTPAEGGSVIGTVPEGTEVNVVSEIGEYYKVDVPSTTQPAPARRSAPAVNGDAADISDGMQTAYIAKNLVTLGEGEGDNAVDTATQVKELADRYFGNEDGDDYQQQLSVSLAQTGGGSEIKAGQELSYEIRYTTKGSPLYGYDTALSMFDEYTDISIRVELPAGIEIEDSQLQTIVAQNTNITAATKAADGNAWIFTLAGPIDASYDRSNMFSFNAKVTKNGAVEVGKTYPYAGLDISMTASFQVLNKVDASNPVEIEGAKYTQTAETDLDSLGTLTAKSDDTWKVEKELVNDSAGRAYTVNADDTVTVHYLLKVGMAVDGYALSDTGAYTVNGRAPFAGTTITISDTPVVTDRDGNAIAATKAVVTPQFGEQKPITYDTTGGKTVEEQLANMQLPYNTSSSDVQAGGVDAGAPYYSTYTVDITYSDYSKNFVAAYGDEDQSPLPAENAATLTYQLQGADSVTTEQDKVQTTIGEVTQPATLTISKEILDRSGVSQGLYRSAWTGAT